MLGVKRKKKQHYTPSKTTVNVPENTLPHGFPFRMKTEPRHLRSRRSGRPCILHLSRGQSARASLSFSVPHTPHSPGIAPLHTLAPCLESSSLPSLLDSVPLILPLDHPLSRKPSLGGSGKRLPWPPLSMCW